LVALTSLSVRVMTTLRPSPAKRVPNVMVVTPVAASVVVL